MRTGVEKALALLEREATQQGLEIVMNRFSDGSGFTLSFQPSDSMETFASCIVSSHRPGEEVLERGRKALEEAVQARMVA